MKSAIFVEWLFLPRPHGVREMCSTLCREMRYKQQSFVLMCMWYFGGSEAVYMICSECISFGTVKPQ
jgi:hypothetical protein